LFTSSEIENPVSPNAEQKRFAREYVIDHSGAQVP
jgi:hypothetical protein